MKTVAFFNNKGGVGKTSLVYHLAWMFEHLGVRAMAVDLDPQSNLTSVFLDEDRLEDVWPEGDHPLSILGALRPLVRGIGDVSTAHVEQITEWLGVIIGDLGLSQFEDRLSDAWPRCLDGQEPAFRASSAFYRVMLQTAQQHDTDLVLLDVGPNLGALNRAALIAADYVVIPLAPDLFSLQGLRNLGPTLNRWRSEWEARLPKNPDPELRLPSGKMEPVGYVIMQHAIRGSRPTRAYDRWAVKIPAEYAKAVNAPSPTEQPPADDGNRLALIKHFRSLMPMAQEARKPIFDLRPADGAIGAHTTAVRDADADFKALAHELAKRIGFPMPIPAIARFST